MTFELVSSSSQISFGCGRRRRRRGGGGGGGGMGEKRNTLARVSVRGKNKGEPRRNLIMQSVTLCVHNTYNINNTLLYQMSLFYFRM